MSWIYYLLEANLYLAAFYLVYYSILRKDTYYQLNRVYLLMSSLLAFIIPLIQIGYLKPVQVYANVISHTIDNIPAGNYLIKSVAPAPVASVNYYLLGYAAIAIILIITFGIRLCQLIILIRKGKKTTNAGFKLIEIEEEAHAFSFFNYLFISNKLRASSTIIQHELVHIKQKHSIDIVYLEIVKIVCWFNPIVYLLQNSIKEVHEFIADNSITANEHNVNQYTDFLINNAYGLSEIALTNNFFNKKLLKNRIMMLHQKRSGSLTRLKYLTTLPLLAGMLCLSTLGFTKNYSLIDLAPGHANDTIIKPGAKQTDKSKLLIKKNAVVGVMDRISVAQPDGSTKIYTASLSNKDKKDLAKKGIEVRVLSDVQITHISDPVKGGILPPPPPVKPTKALIKKPAALSPPPAVEAKDTSKRDEFYAFYKQIGTNVRYPTDAREKNIQGRVFVIFNIDADDKISNIQVARGLTDEMNNEVVRVLKMCNIPPVMKQGLNYTLPVYFALQYYDKNDPVESKPYIRETPVIQEYKKTGFKSVSLNEVVIMGYPSKK